MADDRQQRLEPVPTKRRGTKARLPCRGPATLAYVAILLLLWTVAGCAGGGHQLSGELQVTAPLVVGVEYFKGNANSCSGTGPYSDIQLGSQITVRNENQELIATAPLEPGSQQSLLPTLCWFKWAVTVPDAEFYTISLGGRGELTFSKAEMQANGWRVAMQISGG